MSEHKKQGLARSTHQPLILPLFTRQRA